LGTYFAEHVRGMFLMMKGEVKERWMTLCDQAAEEQDPERFQELIEEITKLLSDKRARIEAERPSTST
jgi:hypothetical protein